jgi:hypothetical protein
MATALLAQISKLVNGTPLPLIENLAARLETLGECASDALPSDLLQTLPSPSNHSAPRPPSPLLPIHRVAPAAKPSIPITIPPLFALLAQAIPDHFRLQSIAPSAPRAPALRLANLLTLLIR